MNIVWMESSFFTVIVVLYVTKVITGFDHISAVQLFGIEKKGWGSRNRTSSFLYWLRFYNPLQYLRRKSSFSILNDLCSVQRSLGLRAAPLT